jgi:hypothetical protein
MTIKVYIYKCKEIYPLTLLVSTTSSDDEQSIYEQYYESFYEILLTKDIIDSKSILVFCNFRNGPMKKQLQIQGSIDSDKDIIKNLESNIKNVDFVVTKIIGEYKANYLLELGETLKIKSTNTKLNITSKIN